jgi:hypothetical protein
MEEDRAEIPEGFPDRLVNVGASVIHGHECVDRECQERNRR